MSKAQDKAQTSSQGWQFVRSLIFLCFEEIKTV